MIDIRIVPIAVLKQRAIALTPLGDVIVLELVEVVVKEVDLSQHAARAHQLVDIDNEL